MRSLGLNVDDTGRIIKRTRYEDELLPYNRFIRCTTTPFLSLSNTIGGGTKPDNSWKIEESKKFTIVPAYNKGPYMVVSKSDLKTA